MFLIPGKHILIALLLAISLLWGSLGETLFAETPRANDEKQDPCATISDEHAKAHQLLREADFDGALNAFQLALRTDFNNKKLIREFETLRQMIKLREELNNGLSALRWKLVSERLRKYYMDNSICRENIELSLKMYNRSHSAVHAGYVVEAFIQAKSFREALFFLETLDENDPLFRIDRASVYLAMDDISKARHLVRSLSANHFCSSEELLRLARIQAATGLHATAVKTLKACFRQTPKSLLAKTKQIATSCPEFEPILASSEFGEALTTRSEISPNDPPCAKKWIGVTIDESPNYLRHYTTKEINFSEWRVTP